MKKIVVAWILVVSFCLATFLSGCAKASDVNEITYIITADTSKVPFELWDDKNKFAGLNADILDAIAADQGFQYNLQPIGMEAAIAAMEAGEADGVLAFDLPVDEESQENYNFSAPYYLTHTVMAVLSGSNISEFRDLAGLTAAVIAGTDSATFAESIQEKYGFTLRYFNDVTQMYDDMKAGNSIACFWEASVLSYVATYMIGLDVVTDLEDYVLDGGVTVPHAFAVMQSSEKGQQLLAMYQAGLKNITENGRLADIYAEYGISYGES